MAECTEFPACSLYENKTSWFITIIVTITDVTGQTTLMDFRHICEKLIKHELCEVHLNQLTKKPRFVNQIETVSFRRERILRLNLSRLSLESKTKIETVTTSKTETETEIGYPELCHNRLDCFCFVLNFVRVEQKRLLFCA